MKASWSDFVDTSGSSQSSYPVSSPSSSSFASSTGMNSQLFSSGNDISSSSSSSSCSSSTSPPPPPPPQPHPPPPCTTAASSSFSIPGSSSLTCSSSTSTKSSLSSSPPLSYTSATLAAIRPGCNNHTANDYYPVHEEGACPIGMDSHLLRQQDHPHDQQQQDKSITILTPASLGSTAPPASSSEDAYDPELVAFAHDWITQLQVKVREMSNRMAEQRDQIMSMTPCLVGSESRHQQRLYYLQNQLSQQWKEIEQLQRSCFETKMKFTS